MWFLASEQTCLKSNFNKFRSCPCQYFNILSKEILPDNFVLGIFLHFYSLFFRFPFRQLPRGCVPVRCPDPTVHDCQKQGYQEVLGRTLRLWKDHCRQGRGGINKYTRKLLKPETKLKLWYRLVVFFSFSCVTHPDSSPSVLSNFWLKWWRIPSFSVRCWKYKIRKTFSGVTDFD